MSTTDGDHPERSFKPTDKYDDPGNDNLRLERYGQQVASIRSAMSHADIPVDVFPPGASDQNVEYMYRADTVVTRDDTVHSGDASKVREVLNLPAGPDKSDPGLPPPIKGVRVHKLPPGRRAADAVAQVEATLGRESPRVTTSCTSPRRAAARPPNPPCRRARRLAPSRP